MNAPQDGRTPVFISYTHKDRRFVERLSRDLRSLGCEVWVDEWKMKAGDSLLREVGKAIKEAQWMVIVLSPAALASEWVDTELRNGLTRELKERKVFILPVVRKKVELPAFLQDRFCADFTKSYEHGFRVLRDRILGDYFKPGNASWLLVKNPLPEEVLSSPLASDVILSLDRRGSRLLSVLKSRMGTRHLSDLANQDLRRSLDLWSRAVAEHDGISRDSFADYFHETAHTVLHSSETESWFGNTGRMILRRTGERVHGEYDWHGLSLPGQIEGEVTGDAIRFNWSWRPTTERGRGVFWTHIPNVLHGGWWADFDPVDEESILSKVSSPPNLWEFVRVPNLTIQDAPVEEKSPNKASDATSEPAPGADSSAHQG